MCGPGTVVIGGSLGGLSTAQALRRGGYTEPIIVVSEEADGAYDRPPLSKQVLAGTWEPARARLWDAAALAELDVTLMPSTRAEGLDLNAKEVLLAKGRRLPYSHAVIATGLAARVGPYEPLPANAHVLRTLEDSLALQKSLAGAPRVVVIGAGFLGLEIASTARELGCPTTIVEPNEGPLAAALDRTASDTVRALHEKAGVAFRWSTSVRSFVLRSVGDTDLAAGVELDSGSILRGDVFVLAIGGSPRIDWLRSSGLDLRNGVQCDEYCAAAPDVYAVGDVANWYHRGLGRHLRLEHRTNAAQQAIVVAGNIMAAVDDRRAYEPVPYVWSDQVGSRLQFYGLPRAADDVRVVVHEPDRPRLLVLHGREGRLVGAVAVNAAKRVLAVGPLIEQRARFTEAVARLSE